MAFEPFAGVFVINEFLGGDRVTTNQTSFFPTLSGAAVDVTAGLNARITDSIYLYGQYEYESADKFRAPWAVNAGLRWSSRSQNSEFWLLSSFLPSLPQPA